MSVKLAAHVISRSLAVGKDACHFLLQVHDIQSLTEMLDKSQSIVTKATLTEQASESCT